MEDERDKGVRNEHENEIGLQNKRHRSEYTNENESRDFSHHNFIGVYPGYDQRHGIRVTAHDEDRIFIGAESIYSMAICAPSGGN